MERIELIKERIKRGYYTAALDELKKLLEKEPQNRDLIKLMDVAIKKYCWYAKKYVKKRFDTLNDELKKFNFEKTQGLTRTIHNINTYVDQLLNTLSVKQKRFIKNNRNWLEKFTPQLYKMEKAERDMDRMMFRSRMGNVPFPWDIGTGD